MVAAVVQHGDALEGHPMGTCGEQRYAGLVEIDVDACELVLVLSGEGAEPLGKRKVSAVRKWTAKCVARRLTR